MAKHALAPGAADDDDRVPFKEVLEFFERHSWTLHWPSDALDGLSVKTYRVFKKRNSDRLPYLIEVIDGTVDKQDFDRIKEQFDD